jgi:hypothetical protein
MGYLVNGFIDACLSYPLNGKNEIASPGVEPSTESELTSTPIEDDIEYHIEKSSRVRDIEQALNIYIDDLKQKPTLESVKRLIASAIEDSEEQTKEAIFHLHSAMSDEWNDIKKRLILLENSAKDIDKKLETLEQNKNGNDEDIEVGRGTPGVVPASVEYFRTNGFHRQSPETSVTPQSTPTYAKSTNSDVPLENETPSSPTIPDNYQPRTGKTPTDRQVEVATWRELHTRFGLPLPMKKSTNESENVLWEAAKAGEYGWVYDATKKQFWRNPTSIEVIFPE